MAKGVNHNCVSAKTTKHGGRLRKGYGKVANVLSIIDWAVRDLNGD
jgi:hypothetical protein